MSALCIDSSISYSKALLCDINDWDVSNVTCMKGMFYNNYYFNSPLNRWDVRNVTNMIDMFHSTYQFNQRLDRWNVSNVIYMSGMFELSGFNQNINNWNVHNVITMDNMFAQCKQFNQSLHQWNVSNVISMNSMFYDSTVFNQRLDEWNVNKVRFMNNIFTNTLLLKQSQQSSLVDSWEKELDLLEYEEYYEDVYYEKYPQKFTRIVRRRDRTQILSRDDAIKEGIVSVIDRFIRYPEDSDDDVLDVYRQRRGSRYDRYASFRLLSSRAYVDYDERLCVEYDVQFDSSDNDSDVVDDDDDSD